MAAVDPEQAEVKAGGGVVWRRRDDGAVEIVAVHRPKYDDWSLPKGKLDPGETWEAAAVREVEEEIGLRCRLGRELPPVSYTDPKGRAKAVRYWLMEPESGTFGADHEIDDARWIALDEAERLLSYAHDRALVREAFA
jgi:8-oxo-dGTP pyrophosphatase MutT (NUDIX family)